MTKNLASVMQNMLNELEMLTCQHAALGTGATLCDGFIL